MEKQNYFMPSHAWRKVCHPKKKDDILSADIAEVDSTETLIDDRSWKRLTEQWRNGRKGVVSPK